jgi:fibronectin type 3 domain-containing protein
MRRSGHQNTSGSRKTRNRVIAEVVRRASESTVEPLENRWMLNSIGFNFTGGSTGQGSTATSLPAGDTAGPYNTSITNPVNYSGPLFIGNAANVQGNWNNEAGASGNQTTNVKDNSGTNVGTTITWAASGTWASVTNQAADGNEELNYGFLNSGGTTAPVTITINNIPYSQYEVYVYELNDGAGRVSTTTAYGVSYVGTAPDPHSSIPSQTTTAFWEDSDGGTPYAYLQASSRNTGAGTPNADLVRFQMEGGTSFVMTEVAPGNGYVNGIQIVDTSGDTTTKPETPVLHGTNSVGAALLTWNSPAVGAGNQAVAGGYTYIIERSTTSGAEVPITTLTAAPGTTVFSDSTAVAQTTYFYKIIAVSPNGTQSVISNEVTAVNDLNAPPGPVSNLTATVDNPSAPTQIILNWTAPISATSGYTVYRSTTGPNGPFNNYATIGAGTSFTDAGVSAGNSYLYEILPNNNGNSTPAGPPAVAAQPPTGSISPFVGQGIGADVTTNPGTGLFTGTGEGVSGYYFNNANNGTWRVTSNFQPATTPLFTPAYSRIDAQINQTGTSNVAPSGAPITWQSNGGVGVSFDIEWLGFVQPMTNGSYTFFPRSDDGEEFFLQNLNTGQYVRLTDQFNVGRGPAEDPVSVNMIAGQLYGMELLYREQGGGWDAELRWQGPGVTKQLIPTSQLYPVAPLATTLTASANDAVISLTWPSMACDQVVLWRGTSAGTLTPMVTLSANARSFLDTGVTNGTTYFYKVTGQTLVNNVVTGSTDSNVASATPGPVPLATSTFNLVRTDWNKVSLNWNAVPFAQQYHVFRSPNSNGSGATELSTVTYSNTLAPFLNLTYNDSTAFMGSTYFYFVVAQYNDPLVASPVVSTTAIQTADMGHGVEAHYYNEQFWRSNTENQNGNTASPLSEQDSGVALSWDNFNGQTFGGVTNSTQANGLGSLGGRQVDSQGFLQSLNNSFNSGSPTSGINGTSWSAVFTGKITVNTQAAYTFVTNSDDDSWVYVDGQLVVNDPNGHGGRDTIGNGAINGNIGTPISLTTGNHSVVVFYSQGTGCDAMRLRWTTGAAIAPVSGFNTSAQIYWNQFALDKPSTIDNAPVPLTDVSPTGIAGQAGQTPTVFMTFNYSTTAGGVAPNALDNAVDFLVERSDRTSGFTNEWLQVTTTGLGATSNGGAQTGVGSIVTFSDATALPGHTYQYRVRAVNFDAIGDPGTASANVAIPAAFTTFGQSTPGSVVGGLEAHFYNDQFWGSSVSRAQSTNSKNVITQWGLGGYMNGQAVNVDVEGTLGQQAKFNGNGSPTLGSYSTFDQIHNINFSVAYTGRIHITTTGTYSFMSNTDDDGYVWISNGTNQVLAEQDGGGHGIRNASDTGSNITPIVLSAGQNYDFMFVESQGGGGWGQNLFWRTPTDSITTAYHLIPSSQNDASGNPLTAGMFSTATPVIAPTALTVGALSNNNRTTLTWTDNNVSEVRYVIERSTASDFSANVTQFQSGMNSGSYIDFVPPNGSYFYRIRAENFDTASAWTNGSASAVATNNMPTLTGFSTTQVGSEIHVSWTNQNNQNNITAQSSSAPPGTDTAGTLIRRAVDAGTIANEVQTVTVTGTAGTFTLTFNGQTTSALQFNDTTTNVQNALNALSSVAGAGASVVVTGTPGAYILTFSGGTFANFNVPQTTGTGAGGATVATATTTGGSFNNYFTTIVNVGTFTDQAIVPGHSYSYEVMTAPTSESRPNKDGSLNIVSTTIPASVPTGASTIVYGDASGNIDRTGGFLAGDAGGLFKINTNGTGAAPAITADGRLRMSDGGANEAHSAYTNVGAGFLGGKNAFGGQFDSEFDFTFNGGGAGTADGMVFDLQRTTNNQNGGTGGSFGANSATPNIGVYFNLWQNVTETGLWLNNARLQPAVLGGSGPSNTGIPGNPGGTFGNGFHANDTFHVSLSYDGIGNMKYSLVDTTTSKTFSTVYSLDPTQVMLDQNTFAGFTLGTGGAGVTADVTDWWFSPSGQTAPTTIKGTTGADNVYVKASALNSPTINYWTSATPFTAGVTPTTAPTGTYSLSSSGVKLHGLGGADILTVDESNGPVFVTNKVYRVNELGTAGTFTISVTANGTTSTTSALAFNASAASVQTALTTLANVGAGGVTVFQDQAGPSGFSGSPYTLTFSSAVAGTITSISAAGTGGVTVGGTGVASVSTPGSQQASLADSAVAGGITNGANMVQTVGVAGTAGTFTLTFNGQTTTPLLFNDTAANVQSALNALSSIGGAGGSVTVTLSGTTYTVTFGGGAFAGQNEPQMTGTGTGGATVTINTTVVAGGKLTVNVVGTTGADTFTSDQPNARYQFKSGTNLDGVVMGNLAALNYIDKGGTDTVVTNAGSAPVTITDTGNDGITVGAGSNATINMSGNVTSTLTVASGGTAALNNTGNNTLTAANAGTLNYNGGTGNPTLTLSGAGTNNLTTGSGTDTITSSATTETIIAGTGTTSLTQTAGTSTLAAGGGVATSSGQRRANFSNLVLSGNSVMNLASAVSHTNRTVLVTNALQTTVNADGTGGFVGMLNINDNDMIVVNAGAAGNARMQAAITSGNAGGAWTGKGVRTANPNATSLLTAIGYALNGELPIGSFSTFDGIAIGLNDEIVKYTYNGDTNFDGRLTTDDYAPIDAFFGQTPADWAFGDINYDNHVTTDDYAPIDAFIGAGTAGNPNPQL